MVEELLLPENAEETPEPEQEPEPVDEDDS